MMIEGILKKIVFFMALAPFITNCIRLENESNKNIILDTEFEEGYLSPEMFPNMRAKSSGRLNSYRRGYPMTKIYFKLELSGKPFATLSINKAMLHDFEKIIIEPNLNIKTEEINIPIPPAPPAPRPEEALALKLIALLEQKKEKEKDKINIINISDFPDQNIIFNETAKAYRVKTPRGSRIYMIEPLKNSDETNYTGIRYLIIENDSASKSGVKAKIVTQNQYENDFKKLYEEKPKAAPKTTSVTLNPGQHAKIGGTMMRNNTNVPITISTGTYGEILTTKKAESKVEVEKNQ